MAISTELIVPATLWSLVGFSVVTWTIIVLKSIQHIRLSRHDRSFTRSFWAAPNLQAAADLAQQQPGPAARLSAAGLQVLRDDASESGTDLEHTGDRQDLLERALRQQIHKERGALESGLAVLASIGNTSPFVGLFGTVWGIMQALTDISKAGSASLEVVAGPIGEALVATGVGIAVAVPAVLAYNFFLRRLKVKHAALDELAANLISLSRKTGFRIARSRPVAATVPDRSHTSVQPLGPNAASPLSSQPA